ncbi:MAG: heme biosynthesis protein HemY [Thiotrichaceae bacterium]|nr:heme biosynthesis protein HemY [Thiotrichaceae bacterium]
MIISLIIFIAVVLIASIWLISYVADNYSSVIIASSGGQLSEISAIKFMAGILIAFFIFYFGLRLIQHFIKLTRYASQFRLNSKLTKSRQGLFQGYLSLIEGNTMNAKNNLLKHIDVAENPALHYLGTARVAHMMEDFDERDVQLKLANESQPDAHKAIAISQAEMQIYANQLEQARAGLITLLEEKPKSLYAQKLLSKVFYKQEDWANLATLLPELAKKGVINESTFKEYEDASLKGIFQMYAHEDSLDRLYAAWKKIPAKTRRQPQTSLKYCEALIVAGDTSRASKLLLKRINSSWDESLVNLYGKITHDDSNQAIKHAEVWLTEHDNCPTLLLTLARLYRGQKLWGKARNFYLSSLNQSPNKNGYLEFAELLAETGEHSNAETCYQVGLSYCVYHKAQALKLQSRLEIEPKLDVTPSHISPPEDFAVDNYSGQG